MNGNDIMKAMGEIDEEYLKTSKMASIHGRKPAKKVFKVAIAAIAAAVLAIPLGVHAYNALIHRGSVEMYLENADKVEASGNVENQIMENEHIRITLDTVLSDGYTALAIVTLDALDDYGKNFVINHPFIMLRRLDTGEAVLPIGSGGMDDWTEQIKNDSIKYYHEIILSKIDTVCDYEMIFYSDGIFKDEEDQGRSSALDENYIPVDNPLGYDFIAKVNLKKNVDTVTLTGENGKKLILSQFEIISNDESLDMIDVEHESFKLIKNDGTFEVRRDFSGYGIDAETNHGEAVSVMSFKKFIDLDEYTGVVIDGVKYFK